MTDLSKKLPTNVGNDIAKSFREAVSLTGPLDKESASRIKSASEALNRTLGRPYDRTKDHLVSSTPTGEQLDKLINDRVPPNYANKAYKRMFWRNVYRVVPFLQEKRKIEDRVNEISLLALTTFGVIFESLFIYSNAIIRQVSSSTGNEEVDPEEDEVDTFDPELSSTTSSLARGIKPAKNKNQHQNKTEENVERKLKNVTPSAKAQDPEAFRDFIGSNSSKIDACKVAITKHSNSLQEVLKWSTSETFDVIKASTLKATQLAQALSAASSTARTDLQPGSYIACQSLLQAVTELNNVVIQSVALNRSQRSIINTKLKELKKREPEEKPSTSTENEEDSW